MKGTDHVYFTPYVYPNSAGFTILTSTSKNNCFRPIGGAMKKCNTIIVIFSAICLVSISLFGCGETYELKESEYLVECVDNIDSEIIYTAPTGLELRFINNTENTVGLGSWYVIEVEKENVWYSCEEIQVSAVRIWTDQLIIVESQTSVDRDYDWIDYYGALSSGKYRIIYEVHMLDEDYHIKDTVLMETIFQIK